jgi:magnesium chelatase family protein
VQAARDRQAARGQINARLDVSGIRDHCALAPRLSGFLEQACEKLRLSARAHHRILRVARTIADLEGTEELDMRHLSEAMGYRQLDRQTH